MKEFDYDMILRYLEGGLDSNELAVFEEQIRLDKDLQLEIEEAKELRDTLQRKFYPDGSTEALRDTLQTVHADYFKPRSRIVSFRRYRWIAAAAAVILAFVVLTIWQPWKEDLYHQYASLDMPGMAERGNGSDSLLKKAVVLFNKKQFAEVIPVFETILKDSSKDAFVQFYYGAALVENGQMDQSRSALTELFNGNSIYKYNAAFFIALGYLKEKDKEHCKEWLKKIPADAAIYKEAKALNDKL